MDPEIKSVFQANAASPTTKTPHDSKASLQLITHKPSSLALLIDSLPEDQKIANKKDRKEQKWAESLRGRLDASRTSHQDRLARKLRKEQREMAEKEREMRGDDMLALVHVPKDDKHEKHNEDREDAERRLEPPKLLLLEDMKPGKKYGGQRGFGRGEIW